MTIHVSNPAHPSNRDQLIATGGLRPVRVWHHPDPILESVKQELLDERASHAKECCGFISAEWDVFRVRNSHKYPYRNFYISDADAFDTLNQIYNIKDTHITAIWHTHTNDVPWPSPRDVVGWPNPLLGWRYLIVTANEVVEWELVPHDQADT